MHIQRLLQLSSVTHNLGSVVEAEDDEQTRLNCVVHDLVHLEGWDVGVLLVEYWNCPKTAQRRAAGRKESSNYFCCHLEPPKEDINSNPVCVSFDLVSTRVPEKRRRMQWAADRYTEWQRRFPGTSRKCANSYSGSSVLCSAVAKRAFVCLRKLALEQYHQLAFQVVSAAGESLRRLLYIFTYLCVCKFVIEAEH